MLPRRNAPIPFRLSYVYPSNAKKSAESCVDDNYANVYKTELTHVFNRSWLTLSSQSLSLSHSKSQGVSCH